MKNPDGIRRGTETAISRGSGYSVGASTKSDVRTCRKSVRNPEKTVTERRRRPRRVPGVILHDFGTEMEVKSIQKGEQSRPELPRATEMPAQKTNPEKVVKRSKKGPPKPN